MVLESENQVIEMKTKGLVMLAVFMVFAFCGIVLCQLHISPLIKFSDNPAPGDTVALDNTTFTFVDGPSSGYNVSIGDTVTESRNNLKLAIQNNTNFEVSR